MPGDFRCLRCEYSCAYLIPQRTRGCGCIGHPAFPTPSVLKKGEGYRQNLGRQASRAHERVWNCLLDLMNSRAIRSPVIVRLVRNCAQERAIQCSEALVMSGETAAYWIPAFRWYDS